MFQSPLFVVVITLCVGFQVSAAGGLTQLQGPLLGLCCCWLHACMLPVVCLDCLKGLSRVFEKHVQAACGPAFGFGFGFGFWVRRQLQPPGQRLLLPPSSVGRDGTALTLTRPPIHCSSVIPPDQQIIIIMLIPEIFSATTQTAAEWGVAIAVGFVSLPLALLTKFISR